MILDAHPVSLHPLSTLEARLRQKNPPYSGGGKWATDDSGAWVGESIACGVADLSPLAGHPFAALDLSCLPIGDLRPLAGMPLLELQLVRTDVEDLEPLRGTPLQQLWPHETQVQVFPNSSSRALPVRRSA